MGRMDATLFVHPAQLMVVIQQKDQIDCKFYRAKKDVNSEKMGWIRATFLEAEMWANRSKPMQVVVNLVNKWFWHVSRWIYIQRPASIFNLSSSSSSAVGTTSRLLLLAALLSTLRYEALLHRWPGHPSTPPHLLFFSTDCRTTPH